MGNKWTSFAIVAGAVIIVTGGVIAFGKTGKNSTKTESNIQTTDTEGSVAGANSDDSADTAYIEKLAKFLTEKGAVMYGAYWCPHCKDQKKLFGDAVKYVNYVECDANGENANPDECKAKDIESYPTWIYQGKKMTGTKSLSDLAEMVGFTESEAAESQSIDTSNPESSITPEPSVTAPSTPAQP